MAKESADFCAINFYQARMGKDLAIKKTSTATIIFQKNGLRTIAFCYLFIFFKHTVLTFPETGLYNRQTRITAKLSVT